jgi:Flp pilus assembly protein TadG
MVEFALVAPIMALILVSLVQFALIFERQIGIENAVRDAARRGATFTTETNAEAVTNSSFVWHLLTDTGGLLQANVQGYDGNNPPLKEAEVCFRDETDASGKSQVLVKVTVTYAHPLFLPLISQILDPIDGFQDSAFRAKTASEFVVQNNPDFGSSIGSNVGYPNTC